MARIAELLVAVNALAGIAAFLGMRWGVRRFFGIGGRQKKEYQPAKYSGMVEEKPPRKSRIPALFRD